MGTEAIKWDTAPSLTELARRGRFTAVAVACLAFPSTSASHRASLCCGGTLSMRFRQGWCVIHNFRDEETEALKSWWGNLDFGEVRCDFQLTGTRSHRWWVTEPGFEGKCFNSRVHILDHHATLILHYLKKTELMSWLKSTKHQYLSCQKAQPMFVLGKYNQNKSFFNSKALHKGRKKKKGIFFFF